MMLLAIAIIIICIGSVSAVDGTVLNSTLETVNDNSQDTIVIDDFNNNPSDGVSLVDDSVSGNGEIQNLEENEVLKASNEDVLGAENIVIQDSSGESSGTINVNYPSIVTFNFVSYAGGTSIPWYASSSNNVNVYVIDGDNEDVYSTTTLGDFMSNGATFTPSKAGTFEIYIECESSFGSDYSQNLVYNFQAGSASKQETEVTISVPSTGTSGNAISIPYSVNRKGTSTGVNEGTLTFYDQNGQIGSPIELTSASGTFTYTYSSANSYNIYAVYTGTSSYSDSQSEQGTITISQNGGSSGSSEITLSFLGGSADQGNGYLYPFDENQAWVSVQGGNYGSATYVNFNVDFGSNSQSSAVIQYKKSTDSSWTDVSFTGTTPYLMFHNGRHDSPVVTWAAGNTYDVRVSNGVKTSNVLTVKCIQGTSYINDFDYTPESGDEGDTIQFKFKPILSSGYTFSQGYVSFFSSENRDASSRLGTLYATSSSEFENNYLTGEITLPLVDTDSDITIYYVFVGTSTSGSGYNDLDSFTFNVKNKAEDKSTTISLTPIGPINVEQGNEATISASVSDGTNQVTAGTITYYDGDSPISGYTDVAVDTTFSTAGLSVGTHDIKAKYNGASGYAASEYSNAVQVVVSEASGFSISVTSPTYPSRAVATVTGKAGETYIITISGTALSYAVSIPVGETQATQEFDELSAGEYIATVSYNGETNATPFAVGVGTPDITITAGGNQTSIDKLHNITVTSEVPGEVTINDEIAQYDLGQVIPLSNLNVGSNEITVRFTPKDSQNYSNVEKTVNFIIEKQTLQTRVVLEFDTDSFTESSAINVVPHVFDENDNEISVGTVTLTPSDAYHYASTIAPQETKTMSNGYNMNNGKYTLSATYNGGSDDDYIYQTSSTSANYYRVSALTNIDLKINGSSTEFTAYVGDTIVLNANTYSTSTWYDGSEITTVLQLLINDIGETTGVYPHGDTEIIVTEDLLGNNSFSVKYYAENEQNVALGSYGYRYGSATSNSVILHVLPKQSPDLTLNADNDPATYVYGNPITITPTVTVKGTPITSGTITYFIDGVENETLSFDEALIINKLEVGKNHNITAYYNANGGYESANMSIFIDVTKASNKVYVTVDENNYLPGDVVVNVEADVAGVYTVTVGEDKSVDVTVDEETHKGSNSISLPAAEGYVANTSFEDSNYDVEITSATFNVLKSQNAVTISSKGATYPNEVTISLTAEKSGKYNVKISESISHEFNIDSDGGNDVYSILLDVATYSPELVGYLDENYEANVTSSGFSVIKGKNIINISVDENNYLPGDVVVNVEADVAGVYTVTVGEGKSVDVTVDEQTHKGSNSISLPAGESYTATTTFEDDNYDAVINPAIFNVLKSDINLKIIIDQIVYGNPVVGTIVTNVSGTYTVKIADKAAFTVDAGVGSTPFASDIYLDVADNYNAQVDIDSQENFNAAHGETTFNVVQSEIDFKANSTKDEYTYEEHIVLNIELPDDATGKVTFIYVNESSAGEISDVTNTKSLDLGILDANSYSIQAIYSGDNNYEGLTKTINFKVNPKDNEVTVTVIADSYPNDAIITVSATIEGDYEIDINGEKFIVTANGEGIRHKFAANSYYANITYKNSNYNVITQNTTFTVAPADNIIVISINPEVIYGDSISVTVNASVADTYYVDVAGIIVPVTVEDASKTETVNIDLAVGDEYRATTSWSNENYTVNITESVFKVVPRLNEVTISIANVEYGDDVTVELSGAVKGSYVVDINGKKVTVQVNDDGTGSATESLDLAAGYYAATLSLENDNYTTIVIGGSFNVTPLTNNVLVEVIDTVLPNLVEVNVTADVAGTYRVYFNDDKYVDVEIAYAGEKQTETIALTENTYETSVEAMFTNSNYTISTTNAHFEVISQPVSLVIRNANGDDEVTANDKYVLTIEYLVEKPSAEIVSENLYLYCNDQYLGSNVEAIVEGNYSSLGTITLTEEGTFVFKVVYNATLNDGSIISAESNELNVTIEKQATPTEVSIAVRDSQYPENTTIVINSKDNVTITLEYLLQKPNEVMFSPQIDGYVNGEHLEGFGIYQEERLVTDIYATLGSLSNISASCELDVYLVFKTTALLGEGYNIESNHIKYIINIEDETPVNITILTDENITYGDNVIVNVTGNIAANYTVTLNNISKNITVEVPGEFVSVDFGILNAGEYIATVYYGGDDNYTVTSINSTVVVNKATPVINVTADDIVYGNDLVVNVKSSINGMYTVTVNDETLIISVFNGVGSARFSGLAAGSYDVIVRYSGNNNYMKTSTNTTVNVISEVPSEISVSAMDIVYGETLTVDVTSNIDGDYNVTVGDKSKLVSVVDGVGSVEFSGLTAGTHTIVAFFAADDSIYADATVKVSKATPEITVTADAITYGETLTVKVVLSGDVSRRAIVTIGNESKTVSLRNGTGSAKFTGLGAGTQIIIASYNGDINYVKASANTTVKINRATPEINVVADSIGYDDVLVVNVTLPDDVSRRAIVTIGNESKTVSLRNGTGSAKFSGLDVGTYTITATYNGDVNYGKASVNTTVKVNRPAPDINVKVNSIKSGEDLVVNVTLSEDVSRRAIVTIGNESKLVSLVNGVGSVKFSGLKMGTYNITVSYNGDAKYGVASVNTTVKVYRGPATIDVVANPVSYGEPIVIDINVPSDISRRLNVTLGNESKLVKVTNGTGSVKFNPLPVGTYNVTVLYNGDDNYFKSSKNITVDVNKATPDIQITANNITYGETAVIEVQLPADVSRRAILTIDGDSKFVTLKSGVGTVKLTGLAAGAHEVTVSYNGDANFNIASAKTTIVVEN